MWLQMWLQIWLQMWLQMWLQVSRLALRVGRAELVVILCVLLLVIVVIVIVVVVVVVVGGGAGRGGGGGGALKGIGRGALGRASPLALVDRDRDESDLQPRRWGEDEGGVDGHELLLELIRALRRLEPGGVGVRGLRPVQVLDPGLHVATRRVALGLGERGEDLPY